MFDAMLESKTIGAQTGSRWAFPLSVLSHVTVIGLIVGASLMVTVSLIEPGLPIIFVGPAAPPPPPPPPPPLGSETTDIRQQVVEEIVPEPEEILQPQETPQEVSIVEETGNDNGSQDVGEPNGVPWGKRDGVYGGDPNGVPDGVLGGTGPTDQAPIIVTAEMTPPVRKHKVEPEYPEIARHARLPGQVILRAVISTTGKVEEVTILRSSNPLFDEASIEAVQQWEYEPARQGGRPVAVYFVITVVFSLR